MSPPSFFVFVRSLQPHVQNSNDECDTCPTTGCRKTCMSLTRGSQLLVFTSQVVARALPPLIRSEPISIRAPKRPNATYQVKQGCEGPPPKQQKLSQNKKSGHHYVQHYKREAVKFWDDKPPHQPVLDAQGKRKYGWPN